ncbi:SURF1 family protein [Paralcaligenes ginsengisoli]
MVLATCAFAGFVLLGNWQLHRLGWKLRLIRDVSTRIHAPPVAAPGPAAWQRIESGHLQYLHVRLTGHFLAGKQTLVHGTSPKGYGYWVMVPFETDRGFIVLINRGYIPPGLVETPGYAKANAPDGEVVVTGLLRFTEPHGGFMRRNRPDSNQWYSRDVAAISKAGNLPTEQVAPYFVDADANPEGWPVGGLTKTHFRNTHLGYAVTWYLMALASLLGAGIMIRHEWRIRHPLR